MSEGKTLDGLLSTLLAPKGSKGPLIMEVGKKEDTTDDAVIVEGVVKKEEGPSLMELMMQAQAEAKKEKDANVVKEEKKETKTFGSGFKKGFFGGNSSDNKSTTSTATTKATATSTTKTDNEIIPTIVKKKEEKKSLVFNEVQKAMNDDDNPTLKQLRQGEWVTPDLMSVFQNNAIISAGLRNPKCTAAMQLMQQDPKEAQKRFANDSEVDIFLKEFGKVMASHFEKLDSQQQKSKPEPTKPAKIIEEVGPLQVEAMKRAKDTTVTPTATTDKEQEKVNKILEDPEIRDWLMDSNMQKILQECGDPRKFQQHMKDPVIAYRIGKLYKAGLVGTAL